MEVLPPSFQTLVASFGRDEGGNAESNIHWEVITPGWNKNGLIGHILYGDGQKWRISGHVRQVSLQWDMHECYYEDVH
eukprot:1310134-Ditylum_brightwellii.AAC.1